MPDGYVSQIGAFYYRGRLIEARVLRPAGSIDERQDPRRTGAVWTVSVDGEQFELFPALPDDNESGIRARVKNWLDDRLASRE